MKFQNMKNMTNMRDHQMSGAELRDFVAMYQNSNEPMSLRSDLMSKQTDEMDP